MDNLFELGHIGINGRSAEEALALAELFGKMFQLPLNHMKNSEFAGSCFECMKAPGYGTNGHIGMLTPDLTAAVEELKSRGVAFKMETAVYDENGRLKNIYLDGEYGGFAIHILEK